MIVPIPILLFFIILVHARSVYVDYPAAKMGHGWIQITMLTSEPVHLESVVWCKSSELNRADPPPPDINECTAHNLMYVQLYPNKRPYLRTPPEAEFNTLYIEPSDLGGWDTERQFDIIIRGKAPPAFYQVVRFNPLPKTASIDTTQTDEGVVESSTLEPVTTLEESIDPITNADTTESPSTTHEETQQDETTESSSLSSSSSSSVSPSTLVPVLVPTSSVHPWRAAALLLGVGTIVIAATTLFIRWRQIRAQRRALSPQAGLNSMSALTAYQWNGETLTSDHESDDDDVVMRLGDPGAVVEMQDMARGKEMK